MGISCPRTPPASPAAHLAAFPASLFWPLWALGTAGDSSLPRRQLAAVAATTSGLAAVAAATSGLAAVAATISGLAAGDFVAGGAIMSRLAATQVALDAVARPDGSAVHRSKLLKGGLRRTKEAMDNWT
jgi:hypothetical protein